MKKIFSLILFAFVILNFTSCKDGSLLSDTYLPDYVELTENLDHAEIVRLPANSSDELVVIRSFSYEESLALIEDFCKIEYTTHYLSLLTTPKWMEGTCLRIIRNDGEYIDYGTTDGVFGRCTNEEEFEAFIAKYTAEES